jgi:hypothetical protein
LSSATITTAEALEAVIGKTPPPMHLKVIDHLEAGACERPLKCGQATESNRALCKLLYYPSSRPIARSYWRTQKT